MTGNKEIVKWDGEELHGNVHPSKLDKYTGLDIKLD